jgi:hypothetical protein
VVRPGTIAAVLAVVLGGCGGAAKPAPPVRLSVDAPADMALVHGSLVQVRGLVSPPGARVLVDGRDVDVRDGRFSADVQLQPGTNLVDVVAGAAAGARPATLALRVRRQVRVRVPDLTGFTPPDAKDALAGLGLPADIHKASGLFDFLLPEDARVCDTDPPPDSRVQPGSTVKVFVAKRC